MKKIRIIGDCHGYLTFRGGGRSYYNLIGGAEYSVQLGDLGWQDKYTPTFNQDMDRLFPQHMRLYGNHDCYDYITKNALGDFGTHSFPLKEGKFEFFYVRGARSIDRADRIPGISWWEDEELNWTQGHECVLAYEQAKPEIVLTHDCAEEIIYLLAHTGKDRFLQDFRPSITNRILQSCLERHRPSLWLFAHHHLNWRQEYKGTTFMCLDGHMPTIGHNMGYVDFDDMGKLITPKPL